MNVQEKAQELDRFSERLGDMYSIASDDADSLFSFDFAADWREEWECEMETFVYRLAKGEQEFQSYEFPEGFFDNWEWYNA